MGDIPSHQELWKETDMPAVSVLVPFDCWRRLCMCSSHSIPVALKAEWMRPMA